MIRISCGKKCFTFLVEQQFVGGHYHHKHFITISVQHGPLKYNHDISNSFFVLIHFLDYLLESVIEIGLFFDHKKE